ncbi:MAG TPA: hypothetical protein VFZ62_04640 [Candidatus Saccharimonadales bacterium]
MAHVIFWFGVACAFGMLIFPICGAWRGRAMRDWFSQLGGMTACNIMLGMWFPSFVTPMWTTSTWWTILTWIMCISGLVIALSKPPKRDLENTNVA